MKEWWRGAIIYQVYPRSFQDTNGDGIGDLRGVTERLAHIASLGVDAVWLSPFFTSPMKDYGYDVADYRGVDPIFGTLSDFTDMLSKAHDLGLKVIIDQVYSHTSDRHAWFEESRQSKDNPRADWYVWADPKPDGTPPSNWLSVFGGPAWSWDARRRQYYLHNFLREQPDLNVRNEAVQEALLDVARFWLDLGVDGFRLDAFNFLIHDAALGDNPPLGVAEAAKPFEYQRHSRNRSQPETLAFIERLRALLDAHGDRFAVAEVFSQRQTERSIEYASGRERCHTAYNFSFLYADELTPRLVEQAVSPWLAADAWPSWTFDNHDAPRSVSRWPNGDGAAFAKLGLALLSTLRGTAFVYQGQELGLPQADLPFEALRDPEAIANWPETLGRDGCRTPMPWQSDAPQAGFTDGEPWLPVDAAHPPLAVDVQQEDEGSVLSFARALFVARSSLPVLREGTMRFGKAPDGVLAYTRGNGAEAITCHFNLTGEPREVAASGTAAPLPQPAEEKDGRLLLPPYGFAFRRGA